MNDFEPRAVFDAYVDGELEPEQIRSFESALDADPHLKAEFVSYQETLQRVRALTPPQEPPLLEWAVTDRIRRRSRGRHDRSEPSAGFRIELAICAGLVCILAALFVANLEQPDTAGWDGDSVNRVDLSDDDRRALTKHGTIQSLQNAVQGNELQVRLTIATSQLPALQTELTKHPHLRLKTLPPTLDKETITVTILAPIAR
jgi:anti-sigma factor RsiW